MIHQGKDTFQDRVVSHLEDEYGAENIEEDKYLPDPYRFCDIWVEGALFDYAIQVENDFEAAIDGVGQALVYSGEEINAVPVLVLPPDHTDEPEVSSLRRSIPVVELDV